MIGANPAKIGSTVEVIMTDLNGGNNYPGLYDFDFTDGKKLIVHLKFLLNPIQQNALSQLAL